MKVRLVLPLCSLLLGLTGARGQVCSDVANGDPRWKQLDSQYARIERAMIAKDANQLFAVYAPDFEAHMANGQIWSLKQSAAYSTAGFDSVKENISISNMLLNLQQCGSDRVKVTVLQQWSRRQMAAGKLRLFQTGTVQDETWVLRDGEWKRRLVDNIRPGVWLVDLKRVDPAKPDLDGPAFDPHRLLPSANSTTAK